MRPFRFGLVCDDEQSHPADIARRAEDCGYATVLFPDHTGMLAPFPAMAAAAAATTTLRVGTQVVNIAFRPLGLLAQEAATVDVLSSGRLELGLGAGHVAEELHQIGLPFDAPGRRVDRLSAALPVLRRLFAGETVDYSTGMDTLAGFGLLPKPPQGADLPLMVAGNGDRLLTAAAKAADIVQITGYSGGPSKPTHTSWDGLLDRVAHVRQAAVGRPAGPEMSLMAAWAVVTDQRRSFIENLGSVRSGRVTTETAMDSPFILIGTTAHITDRLHELRERAGISYVTVVDVRSTTFDPLVRQLAGT
jgi:probable F420-dependent oxidoreductase